MSGPQLPGLALVREPTDEGYLDREGVRLHWLEWAVGGQKLIWSGRRDFCRPRRRIRRL
jgi:hypothetical protein